MSISKYFKIVLVYDGCIIDSDAKVYDPVLQAGALTGVNGKMKYSKSKRRNYYPQAAAARIRL
jgi:hypothetical protein